MDRGQAAHDRVVADLDVPGQGSVVGKNDRVADRAIVADVAVGEKISAIADARFARAGRAAVHGDKFAERIFVADLEICRLALIFQILGLLADRAVGIKFVPRAGRHRPGKG